MTRVHSLSACGTVLALASLDVQPVAASEKCKIKQRSQDDKAKKCTLAAPRTTS